MNFNGQPLRNIELSYKVPRALGSCWNRPTYSRLGLHGSFNPLNYRNELYRECYKEIHAMHEKSIIVIVFQLQIQFHDFFDTSNATAFYESVRQISFLPPWNISFTQAVSWHWRLLNFLFVQTWDRSLRNYRFYNSALLKELFLKNLPALNISLNHFV